MRPGQGTGGPGGPGRGVNVKTPHSEQVAGQQGLTMLRCLSKAPPGVDAESFQMMLSHQEMWFSMVLSLGQTHMVRWRCLKDM